MFLFSAKYNCIIHVLFVIKIIQKELNFTTFIYYCKNKEPIEKLIMRKKRSMSNLPQLDSQKKYLSKKRPAY